MFVIYDHTQMQGGGVKTLRSLEVTVPEYPCYRLHTCLELHSILGWSETIGKRKMNVSSAINETQFWTVSASEWGPIECSLANFHIHLGFVVVRFYDGIIVESLFSCVGYIFCFLLMHV